MGHTAAAETGIAVAESASLRTFLAMNSISDLLIEERFFTELSEIIDGRSHHPIEAVRTDQESAGAEHTLSEKFSF